jgi:subtilisin family serine protease
LPSSALLAVAMAATAASVVVAAGPAVAEPAGPAAPAIAAVTGGGQSGTAAGDKIRRAEWWLSRLHVTQAWQSSQGAGVTVALLSTGVLTSHPDLAGSVTTGPDFTGSTETPASITWGIEGTSAASIIAGHGDNTGDADGLIGIAPKAHVLSIRVAFDAADTLNASSSAVGQLPGAIAEGIRYATDHGAKVIDLPLDPSTLASDGAATGGLPAAEGGSPAERSAISYALGKGVVLIAPAGDNGADGNTSSFPASYPGVIAVGAVDQHGNRASFSTRQSYVAMTAPGVDVTTASRPSGYRTMSTTDAASAMATGVAALIRARYPSLSNTQVRQALLKSSAAPPAAGTTGDGAGTLDALRAMQAGFAIAIPTPAARPSTPAATVPATAPVTVRPLTAAAKPGPVGMARSALRDAACAAGGLIVLLLGVLLGLRLWRRRSEHDPGPAPEPRTLLNPPSGPPSGPMPIQAGHPRHARALAAAEGAVTPNWPPPPRLAPAEVPDSVSPRFAPPGVEPPGIEPASPDEMSELDAADDEAMAEAAPGPPGRARNRGRAARSGPGPRVSGHSLRLRPGSAGRTAPGDQADGPTGPPWSPAPAPAAADVVLPDPRFPAAGPFGPPAIGEPAFGGAPFGEQAFGEPAFGSPASPPPPPHAPGPPAIEPPVAEPLVAPPAGWRPVPPTGAPLPRVPAPPGDFAAPGGATFGGDREPAEDPPARPISRLDRLRLPDSGSIPQFGPPNLSPPGPAGPPGPAAPYTPPVPPQPGPPPPPGPAGASPAPEPWRIPGSSGRFPGAGEDYPAAPPPEDWPPDAFPRRTGRLGRPGEFLPPYAGRPSPADEPEPGPAPDGPQPPRGRGTSQPRPGDSPSGPLYIWNPAGMAEPFPPAPGPEDEDEDPGPYRPS